MRRCSSASGILTSRHLNMERKWVLAHPVSRDQKGLGAEETAQTQEGLNQA